MYTKIASAMKHEKPTSDVLHETQGLSPAALIHASVSTFGHESQVPSPGQLEALQTILAQVTTGGDGKCFVGGEEITPQALLKANELADPTYWTMTKDERNVADEVMKAEFDTGLSPAARALFERFLATREAHRDGEPLDEAVSDFKALWYKRSLLDSALTAETASAAPIESAPQSSEQHPQTVTVGPLVLRALQKQTEEIRRQNELLEQAAAERATERTAAEKKNQAAQTAAREAKEEAERHPFNRNDQPPALDRNDKPVASASLDPKKGRPSQPIQYGNAALAAPGTLAPAPQEYTPLGQPPHRRRTLIPRAGDNRRTANAEYNDALGLALKAHERAYDTREELRKAVEAGEDSAVITSLTNRLALERRYAMQRSEEAAKAKPNSLLKTVGRQFKPVRAHPKHHHGPVGKALKGLRDRRAKEVEDDFWGDLPRPSSR